MVDRLDAMGANLPASVRSLVSDTQAAEQNVIWQMTRKFVTLRY